MKGQPHVLGIVLAGGEGKRLWPLTADRAKPAVPFGGNYRLVDFVLSNLVNAGLAKLCVLTQYKSHSLDRHISTTWRLSNVLGQYVTPVPAQQRLGPRWYTGSADAIFQSLNLVHDEKPDHVVIFGADHVYRMDPGQMISQHVESGAAVTVAGIRVPRNEAKAFGCIDSDASGKITRFLEKPSEPPHVPDDPEVTFASMGNYVFTTEALLDALRGDALNPDSDHDMGGDIIPMLVDRGKAHVYDFQDNEVPGATDRDRGYWRDVGTIDAYYDAHMDLVSVHPIFNLYNQLWPIRTATPPLPPAKFIAGGSAEDSMVGPGSIISGKIHGSVISSDVTVEVGSVVQGSVLLPGVRIGKGAVVRRAILDKNVVVPDGALIGVDAPMDRERYTVSAGGVTVLGKGVRAY
ncbi:glucose-1-phosphate adenylyltransferase [Lentzea sp. DG1S-22]|uniref:glucose-1-phosphate adenylyltransferase n=1 Tax=unclassified Lentzea TaxID=2643253 RepID=UPI0027E1E348|nr:MULTISPECIES: glucose-1-phosphate adenylyltransferase [unclassified Lentzea]MCG8923914.1 glucose-1-phosphate adenylyltransferase [Lentzea sp. CC55]WVH78089.1 glucose-1-phosphate adenylyltransferase [Lentzea sp. DG1S-22]